MLSIHQVSAAAMISASDEKWGPFNSFFSRVGLRTYQHPCTSITPYAFETRSLNIPSPVTTARYSFSGHEILYFIHVYILVYVLSLSGAS